MSTIAHPRAGTPTAPEAIAVPVLPWPGSTEERRRLASVGWPRILAIAADAPPPSFADGLEEWVRVPIDVAELALRKRTLEARWLARRGELWLDGDGLVHRDDRWVALPDGQAAVAAPLIANVGHLVRREDVRRAYEAAVGERTDNAFTAVLGRVRTKLAPLGIALHRLSGGRLLLEVGSSPIRSSAETRRKQLHANLPPSETRIGGFA